MIQSDSSSNIMPQVLPLYCDNNSGSTASDLRFGSAYGSSNAGGMVWWKKGLHLVQLSRAAAGLGDVQA